MKKLLTILTIFLITGFVRAQTPPVIGPSNIANSLYAANFAGWTVAKGNNGPFSWSSPAVCTSATSGGVTFEPFVVGSPIRIYDTASPSHSENVTVTAVNINGSGCSIQTSTPTFQHLTFFLGSATGGLQEAINYSRQSFGTTNPASIVFVTPAFVGTTSTITSALGTTAVSILDLRESCPVAYAWSGSAYVGTNLCGGGSGCTLSGVPGNAVIYTPDGTACSGDSFFTYSGSGVGSPAVRINQGAHLEIDGVDPDNSTFADGNQIIIQNDGGDSAHGITTMIPFEANQTDFAYSGLSDRIVDFDAIYEIDHAGKAATGFLTEPSVGGVAAGTFTGFQSGSPNLRGGSLTNMYGFLSSDAGASATTEESSFMAITLQNSSVNSNYCDFMSRTGEVTPVLRLKLGCGPTAANTFTGPTTVGNLTVTGTCTGCGGGGGGVSSVSNSDGTLTVSPTTGAVVGSLALGHANTWTAKQTQPAPLFSDLTGSTQCLHVNTSGQVSGTGVDCGAGSSSWSALTNPTGNLALTMGANTSTFTFNAATGASDLFSLTDTASNTGTGILFHPHTQSGSTEIPWQADANGNGWKIGTDGTLQGIGSATSHGITVPEGTPLSGVAGKDVLTADSTTHRLLENPNNAGNVILSGTTAARTSGHCVEFDTNGVDLIDAGGACGVAGGGSAFSAITSGTNTAATMTVGSGASLGTTGTGTLQATIVGSEETVTFSATPTFSTSTRLSVITLTGNITSSTLGSGIGGQQKCLEFIQDATGGRTVVAPTNVNSFFTPSTTPNSHSQQCFTYETSAAKWNPDNTGVVNF